MADSPAPKDNIDPSVNVPDGVKASIAAAEAAHKAAYPTPADPNAPIVQGNEVKEPAPTIKLANQPIENLPPAQLAKIVEPGAPAPAATTLQSNLPPIGQNQQAQPQRQQPSPSADQQERQPGADQRQPGESDINWQRRYNAMKGRFDQAENARVHLSQRINGLEQTLAAMAQPTVTPKSNVPGANDPTLDQITPQETADYGEEFIGVVRKAARSEFLPHIQRIEQENAQLKQQLGRVGNVVEAGVKQTLEQYMDTNLSNWRDLNHSEDFLGWLAEVDPYAGTTRHNLLKQAYASNDSGRVLTFFKGFLADEAAVAPLNGGGPATVPANNGAGNPPQLSLETLAAPGRARTAAPSPAENKPVISRGQISAFYAEVNAGKYIGNDAEKHRLEAMIFEAQREGRLVN